MTAGALARAVLVRLPPEGLKAWPGTGSRMWSVGGDGSAGSNSGGGLFRPTP